MKKELIEILLDFAEGRITAEEFWDLYQKDAELKKAIMEDLEKNKHPEAYFDPIEFLNKGVNLQSYGATTNLQGIAESILKHNNVACTPTEFYSERNRILIKIQPEWLDLQYDNEQYLINIVASAPQNLTKTQKLKWCKDRIKEQFRYESKPPRWVQSAEWPIRNGKPLIFKGQSKDREDSERVKYFFYDAETKEEVVVEQYY